MSILVSHQRYLADVEERRRYHSAMSDYFIGIWAGRPKPFQFSENQKRMFNLTTTAGEADRKVPAQPIIFTNPNNASPTSNITVRYNLRKLCELPYQLMNAHREEDIYNHCLFNYNFLHAKLSALPLNNSIYDYESAFEVFYDKEVSYRNVSHKFDFSTHTNMNVKIIKTDGSRSS